MGFVCGLRSNMSDGLSANLIYRPNASVPEDLLSTLEKDRKPGLSVCGVNPVVINPPATPVLRIRCGGSSYRSQPLFVVDGIIRDSGVLSAIDPNAIASIEVVKDAKATAIYGTAGAAGVIVITTRKAELPPLESAEPMEEVVIRTTACYRRTICSYQVSSSVSNCTMTLSVNKKENRNEQALSRPNTSGRLYPNPAPSGSVVNWSINQPAKEVQVFSLTGQWIRNLNAAGQAQGQIPFGGLPAGAYLLRFVGDKNRLLHTERLILQ